MSTLALFYTNFTGPEISIATKGFGGIYALYVSLMVHKNRQSIEFQLTRGVLEQFKAVVIPEITGMDVGMKLTGPGCNLKLSATRWSVHVDIGHGRRIPLCGADVKVRYAHFINVMEQALDQFDKGDYETPLKLDPSPAEKESVFRTIPGECPQSPSIMSVVLHHHQVKDDDCHSVWFNTYTGTAKVFIYPGEGHLKEIIEELKLVEETVSRTCGMDQDPAPGFDKYAPRLARPVKYIENQTGIISVTTTQRVDDISAHHGVTRTWYENVVEIELFTRGINTDTNRRLAMFEHRGNTVVNLIKVLEEFQTLISN